MTDASATTFLNHVFVQHRPGAEPLAIKQPPPGGATSCFLTHPCERDNAAAPGYLNSTLRQMATVAAAVTARQ